MTVLRKETTVTLTISPAKSADDGFYRAGLWVRDGTAGIGTVTYVNPEDMSFGGLGHGVCDGDTGEIMPLLDGTVFSVTISGIVKGENGSPGEIKGYFNASKTGMLTANKNTGVYGIFAELPTCGGEPWKLPWRMKFKTAAQPFSVPWTAAESVNMRLKSRNYPAAAMKKT